MLHRTALAALLALATAGSAAAQPMDCFNDEEEPAARSPVNDLQPPAVGRLPEGLQVTEEDVGALLDAIAAHERRRSAPGTAPGAGT